MRLESLRLGLSAPSLFVLALGSSPAAAQHEAHVRLSLTGPGNEWFGSSLAVVGDVDGDGYGDVIVGAPGANRSAGAAYLISGRNGELLRGVQGTAANGNFGLTVSRAGDVDRDGVPDFFVGVPYSNGYRGEVRALSGRTGALVWAAAGVNPFDHLGFSLGDAGDVNRDGYPDAIAGGSDIAMVFSGKDGKTLYLFRGSNKSEGFGQSVDGAGDTNLDGYADLVVGAPYAGPTQTNRGMVQLLSGKDGSVLRTIRSASAMNDDLFGYSVSGGGDVDGDTSPYVIVGVHGANRVETYSGRDGKRIWAFAGQPGELLGYTCASAGDVDRDGYADFIAGRGNTFGPGVSRVVSGRTGQQLLALQGVRVAGGSDIDGDGYADVVTASEFFGGVWVYSGKALTLRTDVHALARPTGGTQNMKLEAGAAHANRSYWIFGSVTGTRPGIRLQGIDIPLNPDAYTDYLMVNTNAPNFRRFRGTLSATGAATAAIQIPNNVPGSITLTHAFLVYTGGSIHMASNAATLLLK